LKPDIGGAVPLAVDREGIVGIGGRFIAILPNRFLLDRSGAPDLPSGLLRS
jgi:hypothetical protein